MRASHESLNCVSAQETGEQGGREARGGTPTDGSRGSARGPSRLGLLSLSLSHLFLFVLLHGERILVVVRPRVTFDSRSRPRPAKEGGKSDPSSQPRSPRASTFGGGVGWVLQIIPRR